VDLSFDSFSWNENLPVMAQTASANGAAAAQDIFSTQNMFFPMTGVTGMGMIDPRNGGLDIGGVLALAAGIGAGVAAGRGSLLPCATNCGCT
jgi:hypothetical protein